MNRHMCAHTQPDTPARPLTTAGSLGHDVQLWPRFTPGLLQLTLGAVGDPVRAAHLQEGCQGRCGRPRPLPHCPVGVGGGGLTGLLRVLWQLKSQTHGPSSESSSQMPPRCRHSSCPHSPCSPEPEPPEPHSAAGRRPGHLGVPAEAGAQQPTPAAPEPTLLTRPHPGLLYLHLLLAGRLAELAGTAVGHAVAATHGAGRRALAPGTHAPPRRAHGPEGAHCVSAGLCRRRGRVGGQLILGGGGTGPQPAGRPQPRSPQGPAEATCRPIWRVQACTCSSHSLAYVRPSEPHTGWAEATHSEGHTQRPVSASHRAPKRHCPQRSGEEAPSPR